MIKHTLQSDRFRHVALTGAKTALTAYKFTLKAKLFAADTAITGLEKIAHNNQKALVKQQKENDNMKSFLSALTVLAVAGAALGAAGYYLYKKEQELNEYEELLYSEDLAEDYMPQEEPEEEKLDKMARAVADVKEIISSAGENVKETVSGAYNDVKEAIDSAMDKE